uniref:Uncharacterized protein n=1 Tax=Anguilla anguilla TaxID=7936 RepID=A0A0E9UYP5_ANGAN
MILQKQILKTNTKNKYKNKVR